MPSSDNSPQQEFADIITAIKRNSVINEKLIAILRMEFTERKKHLKELLVHPEMPGETEYLKIIFSYFLDEGFAKEVIAYLRNTNTANLPVPDGIPQKQCSIKVIIPGKVVSCLEEEQYCNYSFHFGNVRFCRHPKHLL